MDVNDLANLKPDDNEDVLQLGKAEDAITNAGMQGLHPAHATNDALLTCYVVCVVCVCTVSHLARHYRLFGVKGELSFEWPKRVAAAVRRLERLIREAVTTELELWGDRKVLLQVLQLWLRYVVAGTQSAKAVIAVYRPWLSPGVYKAR